LDDRGVIHFSDRGVPGKYAALAEQRTVERGAPRAESAPAPASIPLTVKNGKRYVDVVLEGPYRTIEMMMLVDTGAQMTMIDEEMADELDLEYVRDIEIIGVSGPASGWIGRLERLKLGDKDLPGLEIMVGPLPGLRLLGTDVLDELEVTIGPEALHKGP
jgi:predicted aspartyl protease